MRCRRAKPVGAAGADSGRTGVPMRRSVVYGGGRAGAIAAAYAAILNCLGCDAYGWYAACVTLSEKRRKTYYRRVPFSANRRVWVRGRSRGLGFRCVDPPWWRRTRFTCALRRDPGKGFGGAFVDLRQSLPRQARTPDVRGQVARSSGGSLRAPRGFVCGPQNGEGKRMGGCGPSSAMVGGCHVSEAGRTVLTVRSRLMALLVRRLAFHEVAEP